MILLLKDESVCEPIEVPSDNPRYRTYIAGPKTRTITVHVDDEGADQLYELINQVDSHTRKGPSPL